MLPGSTFPLIKDLPLMAVADDWKWEGPMSGPPMQKPGFPDRSWIGTDPDGRRWIVKMRGGTYAYREHAFAALAQYLGLSCQSSIFLRLPTDAPPLANCDNRSRNQLAMWLFDEHKNESCSSRCLWEEFRMQFNARGQADDVEALLNSKVINMADWARGAILGHLCGQFEPGEYLITRDHEFVLIDNECMWNSDRIDLTQCKWLFHNGKRSDAGVELAFEICRHLGNLQDQEIDRIATIPREFLAEPKRMSFPNLRKKIRLAKQAAKTFLDVWS